MKKAILCWVVFSGTLFADFRKEFIDEVLTFSSMNPTELVEEQQEFVSSFYTTSCQESVGKDAEVRPLYVTAQGDFEKAIAHLLREKKIQGAMGIIHTPTPATPLCTRGTLNPELVDSTFEGDVKRIYTVMKRPEIIRDFLRNRGQLFICYPKGGRSKRTPEQLAIFEEAKGEYGSLRDIPIEIPALDPDLIGATYLMKTLEGEMYAFSIMARQANAPEDDSTWAIWFGTKEDLDVDERVSKVFGFFGPHLQEKKQIIEVFKN